MEFKIGDRFKWVNPTIQGTINTITKIDSKYLYVDQAYENGKIVKWSLDKYLYTLALNNGFIRIIGEDELNPSRYLKKFSLYLID